MAETPSFLQKLAASRAKALADGRITAPTVQVLVPQRKFSAELVPDITDNSMTDPNEGLIDNLISSIGIIEGFKRWQPSLKVEDPRGRTESIMCQCPWPWHDDEHPSAWVNTDKNVFHCATCSKGGDTITLAALFYGMNPNPTGKEFHDLRRSIALEFNIESYREPSGAYRYYGPGIPEQTEGPGVAGPTPVGPDSASQSGAVEEAERPSRSEAPVASNDDIGRSADIAKRNWGTLGLDDLDQPVRGDDGQPGRDAPAIRPVEPPALKLASVTPIVPEISLDDSSEEDEFVSYGPPFDWRSVCTPGSYIDVLMNAAINDDVPEEYHFWNAMLSVGLCLGRDVTLEDGPPVIANLFLCFMGRSGGGKSKSRGYIKKIVREVMPFEELDPSNRGVSWIGGPGSGEALIDANTRKIIDPSDKSGRKFDIYGNVRACAEYNEFSAYVSKSKAISSTLDAVSIQFYDADEDIKSRTRGTGVVNAKFSSCSMASTVQPSVLNRLVSAGDVESGFLNRWFFVCATPKRKFSRNKVVMDFTEATALFKRIFEWTSPTRQLKWSKEAGDMWDDFFYGTILPVIESSTETDILVRADLMMKKLVLIFAANEASVGPVYQVEPIAVQHAIDCWPYVLRCYKAVDASINLNETTELQDKIMGLLKKNWDRDGKMLSASDLIKRLSPKYKFKENVLRALKVLQELGYIEKKMSITKTGPSTEKYYPKVG